MRLKTKKKCTEWKMKNTDINYVQFFQFIFLKISCCVTQNQDQQLTAKRITKSLQYVQFNRLFLRERKAISKS